MAPLTQQIEWTTVGCAMIGNGTVLTKSKMIWISQREGNFRSNILLD